MDELTYGFSLPVATDLLQKTGLADSTYVEGRVRDSGSSSRAKLFQTPGGGIAARSGSTVSSGNCTEFKIVGTTLTNNTNTVAIYNIWPVALPGSHYILAIQEQVSSFWIALQPGIINLRLSGNSLQYTLDGSNWITWHTATTCP